MRPAWIGGTLAALAALATSLASALSPAPPADPRATDPAAGATPVAPAGAFPAPPAASPAAPSPAMTAAEPAAWTHPARQPRLVDGRWQPPEPIPEPGLVDNLVLAWKALFVKAADARPPRDFAVRALTPAELADAPDASLWRLGHSTLLFKLDGRFWLTDPVFGPRASPVSWAGPKRFHAPPIALADLPPLAGVLLSHDHFDHLDEDTVRALASRAEVFVTAPGVGERLQALGVPAAKLREPGWWQSVEAGGLRLTATPARHFSGRGLTDRNRTLWASWVLESGGRRIFFSGDTGWQADFAAIGERFGPFDLTLIECGAYDELWPDVHLFPEQVIAAHRDLRGRVLLPIHNGTFDLGRHGWTEPFERLSALAQAGGVRLSTPAFGERVDLADPTPGTAWWRAVR